MEQSALDKAVEMIVIRVLERMGYYATPEADEYRRKLALINAKQYLKPTEAAYLLGCSDTHLRNLVKKAKAGKERHPIPFLDLGADTSRETISFPREALLEWASTPRLNGAATSKKKGGKK